MWANFKYLLWFHLNLAIDLIVTVFGTLSIPWDEIMQDLVLNSRPLAFLELKNYLALCFNATKNGHLLYEI